MDAFKKYVTENNVIISKSFLLGIFLLCIFKVWFWSRASWLHPELLGTAAYVWGMPDVETLSQLLRKVFDWKAFDPNVNRVRPLNDVMEVFDAILRPYLARVMGVNFSFTLSSLLTVVLAPSFLYGYLRRIFKASWPALILCMIFIATTGFLSLIVSYIRPAKKLNIVFACMALYFAQRHAEEGEKKDFFVFCSALMASFFSDELGLANYFICGILFWPSILQVKKRAWFFLSLPVIFLIMTKWGLPYIYQKLSVHGAWDALGDSKKFTVFWYLLNPEFYLDAFVLTARSFLATVGIYKHVFWTECLALTILFGLPLLQVIRYRKKGLIVILKDPFVLISVLIFLVNIYDNLLDWYPFPHEISYLGSFNYYYHSNIVVLIVLWLGFFAKNLIGLVESKKLSDLFFIFTLAGGIIISADFILFIKINKLVQIIHLYPFTQTELEKKLSDIKKNYSSNKPLNLNFSTSRELIRQDFENTLRAVFNERWMDNGFYQTFNLISLNPIMGNAYLSHLVKAYYPWDKIVVTVDAPHITVNNS